jgi:hypothetical protein
MTPTQEGNNIAIAFAEWIDRECYKNITGYCVYDLEDSSPDFKIDELFAYWNENVYKP